MRIRAIKPEFWRSQDITDLDWETRLIFIGLWSYVDDTGVGVADVRAIAADLFALEDDPTATRERVRRSLAILSRTSREDASSPLVTIYRASGKDYLHIASWEKHQKIDRPGKSRYPQPSDAESPVIIEAERPTNPVPASPRETVATVSMLEQGNRGTGEQKELSSPGAPDGPAKPAPPSARQVESWFNEFWLAYPRKDGKDAARRRFQTIIKRGADPGEIIDGAKRYATERQGEPREFTKMPEGWLNAGRWEDEPVSRPKGVTGKTAVAAQRNIPEGWI